MHLLFGSSCLTLFNQVLPLRLSYLFSGKVQKEKLKSNNHMQATTKIVKKSDNRRQQTVINGNYKSHKKHHVKNFPKGKKEWLCS